MLKLFVSACMSAYTYVCPLVHIHPCMCTYIYIYVYIYIYMHVCAIYIYIHIYIYICKNIPGKNPNREGLRFIDSIH